MTDGFLVGMPVQWSGFTNAANNVAGTITAVSATSMTISTTGQVGETAAGAQVVVVSPVVDPTFALQLRVTASATGLAVKSLRYTVISWNARRVAVGRSRVDVMTRCHYIRRHAEIFTHDHEGGTTCKR